MIHPCLDQARRAQHVINRIEDRRSIHDGGHGTIKRTDEHNGPEEWSPA